MKHIYDDNNSEISTIIILLIIILAIVLCLRSCQNTTIKNDFEQAKSVTIEGMTYKTTDIADVYSNGEFYDTTYTLVLKDGTRVNFKTYTLKYDN